MIWVERVDVNDFEERVVFNLTRLLSCCRGSAAKRDAVIGLAF